MNLQTRRDRFTETIDNFVIASVGADKCITVVSQTVISAEDNIQGASVETGFGINQVPQNDGVYLSHPGMVPGSGIKETEVCSGKPGESLLATCHMKFPRTVIDIVTKYHID